MFDLDFFLRLFTALTSLAGIYYGFKMFSLVRFTRYWTLSWGFFLLTLFILFFRRAYMILVDSPCDTYFLEISASISSFSTAIFAFLMHRFFVKFLGINSTSSTRDSIRDPIRDRDRDIQRDKEIEKIKNVINGCQK